MIKDLINSERPDSILAEILDRLHTLGPIKNEDLEKLSYLKHFHSDVFEKKEQKLMYLLGLFYKTSEPEDLLSFSYSIFAGAIVSEANQAFTPVQASIRKRIIENRIFSFSAPTSAGKSFLFRELINDQEGDVVIVVPSRALVAEYVLVVKKMTSDQKDILVLQFIDDVNKRKTRRRIFIVTPERAVEIFKHSERYNPSLFLYDEAQISEERIRGTTFDAFVRRSERMFPSAKKVFAHPFVDNPEAQIQKHSFNEGTAFMAYEQKTVGKIYLEYKESSTSFNFFSPFIKEAHLIKNKVNCPMDIVEEKLLAGGTILIYISKSSIYDRSFEVQFHRYIKLCEPITDIRGLEIIDEIESLIGANDKNSELIDLMKRGVVIHHGSIPLNVRFLIERFTNANFARICFATSTLIQGVNMPFDVVWIENAILQGSVEDKTLGLKNLIGRAGRTTNIANHFDYGFVIVKNVKNFVERLNGESRISTMSQLDKDTKDLPSNVKEFVDAVKEENISNEYNLPKTRVERLRSKKTQNFINTALDFLFNSGEIMTGSEYQDLSKTDKKILKETLAGIYEVSLGRDLYSGEKTILSASITILLWQIQGKSFRELLGLRYHYLTNQKRQREIKKLVKKGQITEQEANDTIAKISIEYSVIPYSLPNSNLRNVRPSRFGQMLVNELNYDLIVYDTYDFLDKVISFSLTDIFVAAFGQFYADTSDIRAEKMVNYFKYGTNDASEIWLLRYGFSIEEADLIKVYVISINEDQIVFTDEINLPENIHIKKLVESYI